MKLVVKSLVWDDLREIAIYIAKDNLASKLKPARTVAMPPSMYRNYTDTDCKLAATTLPDDNSSRM